MRIILSTALIAVVAASIALMGPWRTTADRDPPGEAPLPAPVAASVIAEARVVSRPGTRVEVSAEVAARLVAVAVEAGQTVAAGTELARGDARAVEAEIAATRAQSSRAEALAAEARARQVRICSSAGAFSDQERELAQRDAAVTAAEVAALAAELDRLAVVAERFVIRAPISGVVLERRVSAGEVVAPGRHLFTLADPQQVWAEAEIDESDAGHLVLGQTAVLRDGGDPVRTWHGTVAEVPIDVVPRVHEPGNPARLLDAYVLRAKISFHEDAPPRLGQRLDVEIAVGRGGPSEGGGR